MTDCLKGKAHEWRLSESSMGWMPEVICFQCGQPGTLQDLDDDVGRFYALRDERDKLQAELDAANTSPCEDVSTVASRAATNLIGDAAMLKLRQAYIAVVWEAATVQHQGCKQALERCLIELREARTELDACNTMCSDLMNDRDEWQALALDTEADTDVAKEDYQSACHDASDAWGRQIAAEAERDRLKARRCHTCRFLRSGMRCAICELLRLWHVETETTETFGCTLWEEVDTHESYG